MVFSDDLQLVDLTHGSVFHIICNFSFFVWLASLQFLALA